MPLTLTLILIGVLSVLLLSAMHQIWMRQQTDTSLDDAILRTEAESALFHLRVQDFLAGDSRVDLREAITSMDRAIALAEAMVGGGAGLELKDLPELARSVGLRTPAAELKKLLLTFRAMGLLRINDAKRSGSSFPADFDYEFAQILEKTRSMELVCQANRVAIRRTSENLMLIMSLAWGLALCGATAAVWRVEMGRRVAESSLLAANAQLLGQATELSERRERPEGPVLSRSAALTGANESPQAEIRAPLGCGILSRREREVLQLIVEGKSNREVSEILFLSVRTVEAHRAAILRKLKLKNTAELVRYAVEKRCVV
jgi:DNA-binding CsgD family transcriptional regulator